MIAREGSAHLRAGSMSSPGVFCVSSTYESIAMGVYIFRSRTMPWIKVGHFKPRWGGRKSKRIRMGNPWFRIVRRGFSNIVHPSCLDGRLSVNDLDLIARYPTLLTKHERRIHRYFKDFRVGEFYPLENLKLIVELCDSLGPNVEVTESERNEAIQWAGICVDPWRSSEKSPEKLRAANRKAVHFEKVHPSPMVSPP